MKELRPHQTAAHEGLRDGFRTGKRRGLLVIPTGGGKCLGRGTPVMMFDGTVKAVEDVAVGDLLMGPDSTPRRVLSLARGREMMYRVTPTKGDPYTVNESHILSVKLTPDGPGVPPRVVNLGVREYLAASATFRHRAKGWRVGVEFPAAPVEIDPYFLGLWLGDGTARHVEISKPDPEVLACVKSVAHRWGLAVRYNGTASCPTYKLTRGLRGNTEYTNPLRAAFVRLGLMPAKFVPHAYKANTRAVRLAVLAGLLDADGSVSRSGFDFVSKERRLAEDVCFLARSLGLAAHLAPCRKGCQGGFVGDYFRVSVTGDCAQIPTRIPRRKAPPRLQKKDVLVTGIRVEPVGEGDYFGFEIDGDRLFLLGDFTVTHNTITALEMLRLAAEGGRKGLFLCDRRVLVAQAAREARDYGVPCGVVMRDAGPDWYAPTMPVQFCSKDTLLSRGQTPDADLVIVDEAHRSLSDYWAALLDRYPKAWVVGLTATPARADGRGLGRRYEFLVQPTRYSDLISSGVLCPARCYAPGKKVEGATKGKRPTRKGMVGDVVTWWQRLAAGRRTFVFASNVAHSLALRDEFRGRGVPAEHLDGNTPDGERDAVLGRGGRLARGDTLVVCSCSVLKYGVDVPAVECVQIADAFGGLVDYLQACGRGLRASPGKEDCVVIDHAGAVLYHGFPDADRTWELTEDADHAGEYRRKMASGEAPQPVCCPACSMLFAGRADCPACGWRPKAKGREVGTASGTLHRVEREAAALSAEDYRKGWQTVVAQCHHTGRPLSSAAAMFKKRFGRLPWELRVSPLPPSGYNWHTPATLWWEAAFVRAKG